MVNKSSKVKVGKRMKKKTVSRLWKLLTAIEVIIGILAVTVMVFLFVPGARVLLLKTPVGQALLSMYGKEDFDNTVLDLDFDESQVKINEDLEYSYSDEYTNFVMFGIDSRTSTFDDSTNSDSIVIVSIHNTTGEVKMVSIYRDTYLEILKNDGTSFYSKINAAYSVGGATAALNTINTNLDLDITDYVVVNFSGVSKIIDALGGIDVNLTDDEVAQLNHHLKSTLSTTGEYTAGVTESGEGIHLNGLQATTYCRIRKATFFDPDTGEAISNDFGRAARQRSVIMKLVEKAKKAGVSEIQNIAELIFNQNTDGSKIISTSFTWDEIMNLLPVVFDFELKGSAGFPNSYTTGYVGSASCVLIKGLSYNVTQLHSFLYGEEDYVPSNTVQAISSYLESSTGYYTDYTQTESNTTVGMGESGKKITTGDTTEDTTEDGTYQDETATTYDDAGEFGYDDTVDDSGM